MTLERDSLALLPELADRLEGAFDGLPGFQPSPALDAMRTVLEEVADRLHDNYPYAHPMYAGQMLKPPHPVARLAYTLAMFVNPNNHALDGGRASSAMEKEAVARLATLFGWDRHLGHLCSGGTVANLEALWVAGRLRPGKTVVASSQAHYTHGRISDVLKLPFRPVPVDDRARMDVNALQSELAAGDVGTVVVTLGTTGTGSVDPLPEVLALRERFDFRVHVDAAYGGYFVLADNLAAPARAAFDCIGEADSIVVDPHKHGLQPYGCGCVLFRDPAVGRIYHHDSPYTYFSSDELHLGEISLECSRAGASAVALWATQALLPMEPGGAFAADLAACRKAATDLYAHLRKNPLYLTAFAPELDIVLWAPCGERASEISRRARRQFRAAAERGLHLAVMSVPASLLAGWWPDVEFDTDTVSCLRSCLMKPEHNEWTQRIAAMLDEIAAAEASTESG